MDEWIDGWKDGKDVEEDEGDGQGVLGAFRFLIVLII